MQFLRYNEGALLGDIEGHLKITIEQTTPKMEIPVDEFDGKVSYSRLNLQQNANKHNYLIHMPKENHGFSEI